MIDDLDAPVSPAAFTLSAIDVVVRNQVIRFGILGIETGLWDRYVRMIELLKWKYSSRAYWTLLRLRWKLSSRL